MLRDLLFDLRHLQRTTTTLHTTTTQLNTTATSPTTETSQQRHDDADKGFDRMMQYKFDLSIDLTAANSPTIPRAYGLLVPCCHIPTTWFLNMQIRTQEKVRR